MDDATGEPIGLDDIDIRVGWMLDLISCAEAELVSRLWQPATFDVLAAGRDGQDHKLPMQGHVAAARFDPATGKVAPPATAGEYVPSGFPRGVLRQLTAHARRTDGASTERLRIADVQAPPQTSAMARLSAADQQLSQITVTDDVMLLTVKLPTTPAPTSWAQWRRVRLTAAIPPHLHTRAITDWQLPTLVLDRRGLLLRCAATEAVPAPDLMSGSTAVGVDWSPSTLGAAAIATETLDGLVSDYRGWTYDDRGLGIKLARLQTESQHLHRKAARLA